MCASESTGGLLKHVVGPTPRFSFNRSRVGPENFDFCKFPGDADDVDIRTKLWEPYIHKSQANRKADLNKRKTLLNIVYFSVYSL